MCVCVSPCTRVCVFVTFGIGDIWCQFCVSPCTTAVSSSVQFSSVQFTLLALLDARYAPASIHVASSSGNVIHVFEAGRRPTFHSCLSGVTASLPSTMQPQLLVVAVEEADDIGSAADPCSAPRSQGRAFLCSRDACSLKKPRLDAHILPAAPSGAQEAHLDLDQRLALQACRSASTSRVWSAAPTLASYLLFICR